MYSRQTFLQNRLFIIMKAQGYKIVLVGAQKVGKSNLMKRFVDNQFFDQHKVTIGVEFTKKTIIIDSKEVVLQIWDTCGQEQYRALTKAYYQGAAGALLVFDIADRWSFEQLDKWHEDIETNTTGLVTMLVGNKSDLESQRAVSRQEAAKFAFDHNLAYLETSAKTGDGVQSAFEQLAQEIVKLLTQNEKAHPEDKQNVQLSSHMIDRNKENKKKESCC